jgi:Rrf2 family transcriptional regulator, cysteine metabolism repressor
MKISTKSRYGVRMMADLADHYGKNPLFLKDIARREDISEKYLSIIVIPLRSAGLIRSIRGAHGGYVLARPPEEITVADIFGVLEGKNCVVDCVNNPQDCSRAGICPTRDDWSVLHENIRKTLAAVTLADLVKTLHEKAENDISSYI